MIMQSVTCSQLKMMDIVEVGKGVRAPADLFLLGIVTGERLGMQGGHEQQPAQEGARLD